MKIKVVETFPTQQRPYKTYTIEKVKRDPNQAGGEQVGETHRHPLSESDRIKRHSVLRNELKMQKELKKVQVRCGMFSLFGYYRCSLTLG